MCVPVFITPHACRCLWRPEGESDPMELESHVVRLCAVWYGSWEPSLAPLQGQQMLLKHPAPSVVFLTTRIYGGYTAGWVSVLNSQSTGHMCSRIAMNVAQHKTRNLFTTLRFLLLCFLQLKCTALKCELWWWQCHFQHQKVRHTC